MTKVKLLFVLFAILIGTQNDLSAQEQKIVLLKLDDVTYGDKGEAVPPRWSRVADYIESKGLKAGFGIIGFSLAENKPEYFQWVKDRAAKGNIEFWNHGYRNRMGPDDFGEFEQSYDIQYRSLHLTDSLAQAKLGLTLTTWGPHWSSTNENTDLALSRIENIKMTLGSPQNPVHFKGYVVPDRLQMEYPVHNPNYEEFVKYYRGEWKDLTSFYLQGHPNSWDEERWNNFTKIIEFLQSENVKFVTPSEFMALKANKTQKDISYIHPGKTDVYKQERCKLDIHYPIGKKDFSTLVWFHGGGLEGGQKHFPKEFLDQGYAVIAVNYRLSPRAQHPAYLEDAAEAVAWTFENIEKFGGNKDKIYLAGHSAGGYICLMLNLDKSYLAKWKIDANKLAGVFPISGQTTTHYTIRKERGLPVDVPIIDKYAPSNNVRKDASPMILITGDRKLEMLARYEENAHLYALLKALGQEVTLYEMEGFDHGDVAAPACILINKQLRKK